MLDRGWAKVLSGDTARQRAALGISIVEGVVHGHDQTTGMLTFTLPHFDGGERVHGPAPWGRALTDPVEPDGDLLGHDHRHTVPTPGARCLVVLGAPSPQNPRGGGLSNPWIIGVW